MEHYILLTNTGGYGSSSCNYSLRLQKPLHLDHRKWGVSLIDTTCRATYPLIVCSNVCRHSFVINKYVGFLSFLNPYKDHHTCNYIPLAKDSIDDIDITIMTLDGKLATTIAENVMLLHFKQMPI